MFLKNFPKPLCQFGTIPTGVFESYSCSVSSMTLGIVTLTLKNNLYFFFLTFIHFRESASGGGAEREREAQNLKQALGSELSAQSLPWGSNPGTAGIMT